MKKELLRYRSTLESQITMSSQERLIKMEVTPISFSKLQKHLLIILKLSVVSLEKLLFFNFLFLEKS